MDVNQFPTLEAILSWLDDVTPEEPDYPEMYERAVMLMIPDKAMYIYNALARQRVAWLEGKEETGYRIVSSRWDASRGGVYIHAYDIHNPDDTEVLYAGASTSR